MRLKLEAVLLLTSAALVHSQAIQIPPVSATNSPPTTATIRTTTNNVLLDVVVTDKNGQPVHNLGKDKFQVSENGVAQPIAFFEEHVAAPAPPPIAAALHLPPNIYTNVSTTAPDTGPILVLLMDALNTPTADQTKVRLAMLDYLRKIPSGRHIAIFTLNEKLRMLQGFNGDPATLIAALNNVAALQKQSSLTDDPGKDSYADSMPKLGIGGGGSLTGDVLQNFVAHEQSWRMDERVEITMQALNALATYLSALPGRKNLIWFSSSFPLSLGADSVKPEGAANMQTENLNRLRDYSGKLHSTSELLKLARVAVYPMDPSALPTLSMFSSTGANNGSLHGANEISSMSQESSDEMSGHFTMDSIAEATGGRAFHNTNDLSSAIDTVTQLGSDYYTVAYVPKDQNYDGKYRKLNIKVDSPKVKLDYRRGYYAEDPSKSGAVALSHPARDASVLLHGAPAATDILFKVRVAPAEKADPGTPSGAVRYSINWSVDIRGLDLATSSGGEKHGSLALAAVAYNSDSKVVNTVTTPASLILQPTEYRLYLNSGLQFHQELDLPVGSVYLRMAIVNTDNQRAGATEIPLTIAPPATH
jgi:VWFA-related protein